MADGGGCSESEMETVDIQIIDCCESEEEDFMCMLPHGNRFEGVNSGRGSGWTTKRRAKRKKVSSAESIDTVNKKSFIGLENDDKLSFLFESVARNSTSLDDVRKEQTTFRKNSSELNSYVDQLREQVKLADMVIHRQMQLMKMLAYRSIDTEAQTRRKNLIIWGISENSRLRLETLVMNFLEDEMKIDLSRINVDSAQRIGSTMSQSYINKPDPKRPIVVRFHDFSDTDIVMKSAFRLKGTPFGIDRDYPREIAIARKELYTSEDSKIARQNRNKLHIRYPAKLYVNNILVCDKFPDWNLHMKESRVACVVELESNCMPNFSTSVRNKHTSAYHLDTDADQTSNSEEEQSHDEHDSVFTRSDVSDEYVDKVEGNAHLSSSKRQTNVSHGVKFTRRRKINIRNSPKSPILKSNPKKTFTHSPKQNSIPKSVTKSPGEHKNEHGEVHIKQPNTREGKPCGSKNRQREKPTHVNVNSCAEYIDNILVATEDRVTQL